MSDNGYLILKNYRAPRECILSKFVNVSEDGKFTSVGEESTRLAYGGMLKTRIFIASSTSYYLAR